MAVTLAVTQLTRYTPELERYKVDVTFDDSYLTGGESVDMSAYLPSISEVVVQTPLASGYGVEVIDTSFATGSFLAKLWYGDYSNGSDGPLVEVPSTTDVATVVATFIVSGKQFG